MANMNGKDFLLGAVAGAVVGALTALLLAPKSGRELRGDIVEQYHNVAHKTQEFAQSVSHKSQELAGKARELANAITEDLRQLREGRKEAASANEPAAETQES
jgi:gas vesicle protein